MAYPQQVETYNCQVQAQVAVAGFNPVEMFGAVSFPPYL